MDGRLSDNPADVTSTAHGIPIVSTMIVFLLAPCGPASFFTLSTLVFATLNSKQLTFWLSIASRLGFSILSLPLAFLDRQADQQIYPNATQFELTEVIVNLLPSGVSTFHVAPLGTSVN
jgi:hypothetical protein